MSAEVPITVGLPVYNRAKYIRHSLDSLLAQSFGDFELVICDNASTDDTDAICREYAARDPRIRYFRNPENLGANRNFNRVFELSRGKYLKWSTSDDVWAPTMLEKTFAVMEDDPGIVLCYPKTMIVDARGNEVEPYEDRLHLMQENPADRFVALLERIGLCHQHLGLIRRDALARTALLGDHISCDLNLLAELTLYGKYYEYPERLFFRRFHPEASSWKKGPSREAVAHQLEFTDPQRKLQIVLHLWRRYAAFFSAIRRAPLGGADRLRLYRYVLRLMRWNRDELFTELASGWTMRRGARRIARRLDARRELL